MYFDQIRIILNFSVQIFKIINYIRIVTFFEIKCLLISISFYIYFFMNIDMYFSIKIGSSCFELIVLFH